MSKVAPGQGFLLTKSPKSSILQLSLCWRCTLFIFLAKRISAIFGSMSIRRKVREFKRRDNLWDWLMSQPSFKKLDDQYMEVEREIGGLIEMRRTAPIDYSWVMPSSLETILAEGPEPMPIWQINEEIRAKQQQQRRLGKQMDQEAYRLLAKLPPDFHYPAVT